MLAQAVNMKSTLPVQHLFHIALFGSKIVTVVQHAQLNAETTKCLLFANVA